MSRSHRSVAAIALFALVLSLWIAPPAEAALGAGLYTTNLILQPIDFTFTSLTCEDMYGSQGTFRETWMIDGSVQTVFVTCINFD